MTIEQRLEGKNSDECYTLNDVKNILNQTEYDIFRENIFLAWLRGEHKFKSDLNGRKLFAMSEIEKFKKANYDN